MHSLPPCRAKISCAYMAYTPHKQMGISIARAPQKWVFFKWRQIFIRIPNDMHWHPSLQGVELNLSLPLRVWTRFSALLLKNDRWKEKRVRLQEKPGEHCLSIAMKGNVVSNTTWLPCGPLMWSHRKDTSLLWHSSSNPYPLSSWEKHWTNPIWGKFYKISAQCSSKKGHEK